MPQQVLTYPTPRRPSQLCSIAFLKYALFCFNAIFMMTGFTLLGFGIWTLLEKSYLSPLLSPFFVISVYSTAIGGAIALTASIIGCHGTVQLKSCSLIAFAVLLVIIFLIEVGTGVISYLLYANMTQYAFTTQLSASAIKNWGAEGHPALTEAVDQIQIKYKCCGAANYREWRSNHVIQSLNTTTPDSCCITPVADCGRVDHPSNLNREGCAIYIEDDISLSIVLIPALNLGFSIIQIFGVIFACALNRRLIHSRKFIRRKYSY